jgi:hypothetical protein
MVFLFLAVYAAEAGQDTYVRGAVIWTNDKQTVTECTTGHVYWIRVLASNPHFLFSKRVDELNSNGAKTIIAEFRGVISLGMPSLGPQYPVDGTLNVHNVISVEKGNCEESGSGATK